MLYAILTAFLLASPIAAVAHMPQKTQQQHKEIQADQLKSWYDQNKPMTVVDALSKSYFDGVLLPQAKWLPAESSEKEIMETLPSKQSLIVVYCASSRCPASGWLYNKLIALGYTNVYEYRGGLVNWQMKGFPTSEK